MTQLNEDPHEAVARWVQEAGRRSLPAGRAGIAPQPRADELPRSARGHARQLVLFGVLALSFLQYYALDVMVQIEALHSIVVFVPVADARQG